MRAFFRLLTLFIKQRIKSAAFLTSAAVLLLLFASFVLLCPTQQPPSAEIGLMYDPSDNALQSACTPLLKSTALRFVYYTPDALNRMKQDVTNGTLHCAYRIDLTAKAPITVYENTGAFLTPATDELVFSAWFETQLQALALAQVENPDNATRQLIANEMLRLSQQDKPFTFDLTLNTAAAPPSNTDGGLAPLFYAVLIPLFLLCFAFSALLQPDNERELISLLRQSAINRYLPSTAAIAAQTMLFAATLIFCEILMTFLTTDTGYSPTAKAALILLLSFGATLLTLVLSRLRPNTALLFLLLVWASGSIIFSGAIVSPTVFGSIGLLRYLSPSWWLLQLMTVLS